MVSLWRSPVIIPVSFMFLANSFSDLVSNLVLDTPREGSGPIYGVNDSCLTCHQICIYFPPVSSVVYGIPRSVSMWLVDCPRYCLTVCKNIDPLIYLRNQMFLTLCGIASTSVYLVFFVVIWFVNRFSVFFHILRNFCFVQSLIARWIFQPELWRCKKKRYLVAYSMLLMVLFSLLALFPDKQVLAPWVACFIKYTKNIVASKTVSKRLNTAL